MADPALPDPASLETARPGPDRPRARPRRVPSLPTVLASAACFLVVFEFLAFQLRSGRDPAIGASAERADGGPTPPGRHPPADRRPPGRRVEPRRLERPGGRRLVQRYLEHRIALPLLAAGPAAPAPAPAPVTSTS